MSFIQNNKSFPHDAFSGAHAAIGIIIQEAQRSRDASELPMIGLSCDELIQFCQLRLQKMDGQIRASMAGQESSVKIQGALSEAYSKLKSSTDKDGVIHDPGAVADALQAAADACPRSGEFNEMRDALASKAAELRSLNDDAGTQYDSTMHDVLRKDPKATPEIFAATFGPRPTATQEPLDKQKVDGASEWMKGKLEDLRGGSDIAGIRLNSFVSARATMLTQTSGMVTSISDTLKSIAGNIGR